MYTWVFLDWLIDYTVTYLDYYFNFTFNLNHVIMAFLWDGPK